LQQPPHLEQKPSEQSCFWRPGAMSCQLERLLFDQSPLAAPVHGAGLIDDLLSDSPPTDVVISRGDIGMQTLLRPISLIGCVGIAPSPAQPCSIRDGTLCRRLAVWFVERPRGDAATWERVTADEEERLSAALVAALARMTKRRGGSVAFFSAFCSALGDVCISGLRCVPLSGELARLLPSDLLDPCVHATRLPAMEGGGGKLAGSILQRVKATVEELLRAGVEWSFFKIGITCNPISRWRAYEREGFAQLHLLHATEEPSLIQMLEAALIDTFRAQPGCRNVAPGGEGRVGRTPYFAYLAVGTSMAVGRKRAWSDAGFHEP